MSDVLIIIVHQIGYNSVIQSVRFGLARFCGSIQLNLCSVDLELLEHTFESRVVITLASDRNDGVIKVFQKVLNFVLGVSIWVHRNKNSLQLEVLLFWLLPHNFEGTTELAKSLGTDIRTVSEPKVDNIVLSIELSGSKGLAIHVSKSPITSNIGLAEVPHALVSELI